MAERFPSNVPLLILHEDGVVLQHDILGTEVVFDGLVHCLAAKGTHGILFQVLNEITIRK